MFQMTKEDAMNTLKNYSMLMSRVKEVVDEIGFLDKEFDTLDINKTDFTCACLQVRESRDFSRVKVSKKTPYML